MTDQTTWRLEDLLTSDAGDGAPADDKPPEEMVDQLLTRADKLAEEFSAAHAGKVADLDGPGLLAAMNTLAEISDLAGRALNFAHLRFAGDTADPKIGALLQSGSERATSIQTKLLFFELEWVAIDDARADELLETEGLDFCRHYLRTERRYRDHVLSAPEETVITEFSVIGGSAWGRLFDELTSALQIDLPGADGPVTLDQGLSNLMSPDREVRRTTAEAVTKALQPGLRTRGYVFNTLLQEKSISDRLRSYPSWLATRNLSNEVSDESVQALVEAVKARYELARRWYRTKAKLLGVEKIADYDRMAAVSVDDQKIEWDEGREIVLDTFGGLSPVARGIAEDFIGDRWVDVFPREGKRGGAFSAATVPSVHPYVMLNYTDRRRDVLTLAHELGHGIHQTLARQQGTFHQNTPLTVAETASVFAEQLVFGRLLEAETDPRGRLALLAESIEGQIATVFRQIAMNQFEDQVHTARREEGELSTDRFGELWMATQTEMLGDSVEISEGYASWWSYVPHFMRSPGYVYAYAFGQLLAISIYRLYTERGQEIVPEYLQMLSAGGSKPPEELAAIVGVDLADPGFWDSGLDLVEETLDQAEAAAAEVLALDGDGA
jgi:oligoendopeptidase F